MFDGLTPDQLQKLFSDAMSILDLDVKEGPIENSLDLITEVRDDQVSHDFPCCLCGKQIPALENCRAYVFKGKWGDEDETVTVITCPKDDLECQYRQAVRTEDPNA